MKAIKMPSALLSLHSATASTTQLLQESASKTEGRFSAEIHAALLHHGHRWEKLRFQSAHQTVTGTVPVGPEADPQSIS